MFHSLKKIDLEILKELWNFIVKTFGKFSKKCGLISENENPVTLQNSFFEKSLKNSSVDLNPQMKKIDSHVKNVYRIRTRMCKIFKIIFFKHFKFEISNQLPGFANLKSRCVNLFKIYVMFYLVYLKIMSHST